MACRRTLALTWGLLLCAIAFSATPASAQALTWGTSGNGGTSTWNTSSLNWWNGSNVAWPSAGTNNDAVFSGTAGTVTIDAAGVAVNDITFTTTGYTLSGGGTVTLNGSTPTITLGSGISATIGNNTATVLAGSAGLTKAGAGALTLNGSAVHTFTGGLNLTSGALTLDYTNLASPTNLIDSGNALTMGGATLAITGKNVAAATTSQTFASTTLNSGMSVISINKGATATSATLALGAITRTVGSSMQFLPNTAWLSGTAVGSPSTTEIVTTTGVTYNGVSYALPSGGNWSYIGAAITSGSGTGTRYVQMNSIGQLALMPTASTWVTTGGSGTIAYNGGTTSQSLTGNTTMYAILANNTNAQNLTHTLSNGSTGYTLTTNGILSINTGTFAIAPGAGSGSLQIGVEKELVINAANSGAIAISAPITNNGANASSLTVNGTGSGIVTLSGANTYTGTTTVLAGVINLGAAETAGTSGPLGNSVANNPGSIVLSGGTLQYSASNANDYSGRFGTAANQRYNVDTNGQSVTWATALPSSGGSLAKSGAGTLRLSGSNSYTGATVVTGGTLSVGPTGAINVGATTTVGTGTVSGGGLLLIDGGAVTLRGGGGSQGNGLIVGTSSAGNVTVQNNGSLSLSNGIFIMGQGSGSGNGTNAIAASVFTQTGGTTTIVSTGANYAGNYAPATLTISGGSFTATNQNFVVGTRANTSLTISGSALASFGTLQMGHTTTGAASTSILVNLTGGTLAVTSVTAQKEANKTNTFNFDGGTLRARAASATFFTTTGGTATAYVKSGGAIIDDGGFAIGIGQSLLDFTTPSGGGLTKLGSGTLTLSGSNTYTGTTTLSAGVVNLGVAETSGTSGPLGNSAANNPGSIVLNGGTLQYSASNTNDYSGRFSTAANQQYNVDTNGQSVTWATALTSSGGSLTKTASGTLALSGSNTYTGATSVTGGVLSVSSDSNLGAAPGSATAGQLVLSGGTLAATSGFTLNANRGIVLGPASASGTGGIDVALGQNLIYGGIIANGSGGTGGLTKSGAGTLTLSGANTYTGVTAIGGTAAGVIVTSNNAMGTAAGNTTVASGASLGLSGGVNYSTAETIVGSGAGSSATGPFTATQRGFVQSVSGSNTFGGAIQINAAGTTRIGTQDGASLTLTGPITMSGVTGVTILFRAGGTDGDFVTLSNSGNSWDTNTQIFTNNAGAGAGVRLGVDNALPTGYSVQGSSSTGAGTMLDLAGYSQTLNGLVSSANALKISNSNGSAVSVLTLNNTSNQASGAGTVIVDGAGKIQVVKTGTFNQTLQAANTYTGGTWIKNGSLTLQSGNDRLATSGTVTLGDSATTGKLVIGEAGAARTQSLAGLTTTGLGGSVVGATTAANSTLTLNIASGTNTFSGTLGGAGTSENNLAVTKLGTGTLILSGSSSYVGNTLLGTAVNTSTGVLRLANSSALGAGKLIINNGSNDTGSVELVGGVTIANNIDFFGRNSNAAGIIRNVSGDNQLSGTLAGSFNGPNYSFYSDAGTLTISNRITTNSAGRTLNLRGVGAINVSGTIEDGTGSIGIRTLDAGTYTLGGANTYTGATTLGSGTLNISSIANGGASSNIGASSSAAANLVFDGGTMRYTGSSATSDRAFTVNAGRTAVFDITSAAANLTLDGATGAGTTGALTKRGAGALTLAGVNTYTGLTNVEQGSLVLGGGNDRLATTGTVSLGAASTSGKLVLGDGAARNQTLSGLAVTGLGGSVVGGAGDTSTLTVAVSSGTNDYGGVLGGDGTNENSLALAKSGLGTLALSGSANTYFGKTTVGSGVLTFSTGNVSATGSQSLGAHADVDLGVAGTSSGRLRYTGVAGALAKNVNALGNGQNVIENAGTGLLTLSGTLAKNGTILRLAGGAYGINVTGAIVGSSANSDLEVDGGTTTLSAANTYNGPTFIFNGATLNANAANALPTENGRTAVFMDQTGSGGSSLVLGVNQAIASLTGAAGSSVDLGSSTLTVGTAGSGTSTFAGFVFGAGSLTKDGGSVFVLSGSNAYGGGTTISGGTLVAGHLAAFGTGGITLGSGAFLDLANFSIGNAITNNGGTILNASGYNGDQTASGDTTFDGATSGTIDVVSGTSTFNGIVSGSVSVASGASAVVSGGLSGNLSLTGGSATVTSAIGSGASVSVGAGSTLTLGEGASFAIDAVLAGLGVIEKTGTSVLQMTGSNPGFNGSFAVTEGGFSVNGLLGSGSASVSIGQNAWLGGSGSIDGAVSILGTLSPGNSPGVLEVGSLSLLSTSTTSIEINGIGRGVTYDGIDITDPSGLSYGGLLSISFGNTSEFADNTVFDLFAFTGSTAGAFSSVTSTGFYAGTWTNNNDGTFKLEQGSQTLTFSQATGDIIVVPEPATLALAAIGLAAGMAAYRRRRA